MAVGRTWFSPERRRTTAVQDGAAIVGIVFVVVGVLGFLPGITTGFDGMTFAGAASTAELFGIFEVSILHNLVHIVFGVIGLFMSWVVRSAWWYLVGGGIVYAALAVYGFFVSAHDAANFLPANSADDWLHLGLGVVMVVLGLILPRTLPDKSLKYYEGQFGEDRREQAQ